MRLSKTLQRVVAFRQKLLDLGVKAEDIKFDIRPGGNVWAGVLKEDLTYVYFDLFGYVSSSSEKELQQDLNKVFEYFSSLSDEKKKHFLKENSDFFITGTDQFFDSKFLSNVLTASKIPVKTSLN